jgi:putative nucleotidyltransferase with HDIG domain
MPLVSRTLILGLDLPGPDVPREGCERKQHKQRTRDAEADGSHPNSLVWGTDGKRESRQPEHEVQEEIGGRAVRRKAGSRERLLGSREALLTGYACVLVVTALSLLAGLVLAGFPLSEGPEAWSLLAFALLAILVERQSVRFGKSVEISVAFLPLVFVAVAFGPVAAGLVGAATMALEFPLVHPQEGSSSQTERPYLRWIVWTSNRLVLGCLAGLAAHGALQLSENPIARVAIGTGAAAAVNFGMDLVLAALTLTVRGTGRIGDLLKSTAPIAAGVPVYTAVAGLLAYAYMEITTWSAALFFIPALAAHRLFVLSRRQQQALADLETAYERLEKANLSFATALVATLDARDRYTAGHSAAVAVYARDIAARMGLPEEQQRLVHLCGLVHDIGKIGLPPGLLEKPGALTLEERRQMEEHSTIGERILAQVDDYSEIALIVRHHHERMDGHGYPDGLIGADIPVLSRIIAVADAYDAMTSDRPYRDAMPSQVARMRLAQAVESQFDTTVVAAFEAILATADEAYRSGTRHRFTEEVAATVAPEEQVAASVV